MKTMLQRLLFSFTLLFLCVQYFNAQTLTWFHVDDDAMQPAGFRYYNQVNLGQDRIAYSFMTQPRYNPGFYGYGDMTSKMYDTDGNYFTESSSAGDSLFIRKTLLLSNGETIVLGNSYANYAMFDLDTTSALNQWGEVKSYIHHLDENNQTIRFTAFDEVMDVVTNESETNLYLVNLYNFDEADVLRMSVATGVVTELAHIEGIRSYPVLLKTDSYLYITGATINPQIEIDAQSLNVEFDYTNVLIQFNEDGTYNWIRQLEDITTSLVGMAEAPSQGLYFSSDLYDGINIGNQPLDCPTWGSDFYITRIDVAGNFQWVVEAPNNTICDFNIASGRHLASDDEYNVYIAGGTRKLLVWDSGTTVGRDTNVATPTMLKFNSDGELIGSIVAQAGQAGNFYSMDVNGQGDLLFTGLINDSFTFDGQALFVIDGNMHAYVLYYKNESVGVTSLPKRENSFSIYPNLITNNQPIQIRKSNAIKEMLTIYNIQGALVHSQNVEGTQSTVVLPSLPSGNYVVKVGESVQRITVFIK